MNNVVKNSKTSPKKSVTAKQLAKSNLTKRKNPDWDNLDRGYRYLTLDMKLPHDLAVAVMGNVVEESLGDYKAALKNGGGRGLIQWDGKKVPSGRYSLWGSIWASVAKPANVYDSTTDTVKNYWAPWGGLKGDKVRLKFIKAPIKEKARIYAESYLRPGKPRIADRQLSAMQLDSIYNPRIKDIIVLKNGGQIRKMLTAAGGPLNLSPEDIKRGANLVGEYFLKGLGAFGKIATAPFRSQGPTSATIYKSKELLAKERTIENKSEELLGKAMTWVSPFNYGAALVTGNGLNAKKGGEEIEKLEPWQQALLRGTELYVGPKAVKGVKATPKAVVNTAAKAGNKTARAYLVSKELNKGVKLNTKNGRIEVTENYFNSPDKWYRITETPEKYGIMELGKNVTTHDAPQTHGTINGWRSSMLKAPITKSSEGFIKRPQKIEIGIRRKNGQAHGNTSQAAKGKLWGGTTSGSNLFPEGIIEGQAPSMINYGIDRTNFVMTPWELIPNGGRVGFHTGEMPLSNLGWLQRTNKGTYTYEPIIPEKRINFTPTKLLEPSKTSSTIQISPEELYKVLKGQELNGYYFMGHGTGRTGVNPQTIFDNGLRVKDGDIGNTTMPISESNLTSWPHMNSEEIIIMPGKATMTKYDSAHGHIPSDWYSSDVFHWTDNPKKVGSGPFAAFEPNASFTEQTIGGVPGVYTKPEAVLGSYNTRTHTLKLNPKSLYAFLFNVPKLTEPLTSLKFFERGPAKISEAERAGVPKGERFKNKKHYTGIGRNYRGTLFGEENIPKDIEYVEPITSGKKFGENDYAFENRKYATKQYLKELNNRDSGIFSDKGVESIKKYISLLPDDLNPNFINTNGLLSFYIRDFRLYLNDLGYRAGDLTDTEIAKLLTNLYDILSKTLTGKLKGKVVFHSGPNFFDLFDFTHTGETMGNMGYLGPGNYFSTKPSVYGGKGNYTTQDLIGQYRYPRRLPYLINNIKATPVSGELKKAKIIPEYTSPPRETYGDASAKNNYILLVIQPLVKSTKVRDMAVLDDISVSPHSLYTNGVQTEFMVPRNTGIKSLYPHPSLFIEDANGKITLNRNWDDIRVNYKQGGKMNILEFLKNGSGIHIKEKNKGKFTSYCGGKVTNECILKGKNSSNPAIRKRATFADNARHFKHHLGGRIRKAQLGMALTLFNDPENPNAVGGDIVNSYIRNQLMIPYLLALKEEYEKWKLQMKQQANTLKSSLFDNLLNTGLSIGTDYLKSKLGI